MVSYNTSLVIMTQIYNSVATDDLMYHWHARAVEYVVLHANDIDALSIIKILRNGAKASLMTPYHEQWSKSINNLKALLKNGTLTPIRTFNIVAKICDNPELPQQHGWSRLHNTVLECVMNNLQFNNVLSYTIGWPKEYTDDPKDLAPGELPGKFESKLSNNY